MKHIFLLPTEIYLERKSGADKKIILNLNNYHTWHYHVRNEAKQTFYPIYRPLPFIARRVRISYHVEKRTKRKFDTMNIVSVVDKFFLDWLIARYYIGDDTCCNVEYGSITGEPGCDKNRVIAEVDVLEYEVINEK